MNERLSARSACTPYRNLIGIVQSGFVEFAISVDKYAINRGVPRNGDWVHIYNDVIEIGGAADA
jgi:hypothetical protein